MQKNTGILMLLTPMFVVAVLSTVTAHALAQDSCISFVDSGQSLGIDDVFVSALVDVDGDGDLDIVTVNGRTNAKVWLNDGSGYFTDSGQLLGTDMNHGVALGDLDSDDDLDIFLVHNQSRDRVFLNDGTGTFTDTGQRLGTAMDGNGCFVWLADVDNDSDLDAVVHQHLYNNVIWYNDGNAYFADSSWNFGGQDSGPMGLGDFDDDGDEDIFLTYGNNPCGVWLNDGSGTFVDSGQLLGSVDDWGHVAIGDLDGDNDLDAFTTNYSSGNMVWLNDGAALFDSAGPFFGGSSQKIALGDIDGDGDLDACTTHLDNGNYVWVNDGTGTFASAGPLLGAGGNISVSLGDLDGDGDLDAVIGGTYYYGAQTKVYFNTTDPAGIDGESHSSLGLPSHQIVPNPFRGAARISYTTDMSGVISLIVYNTEGREIRTVTEGFCRSGSYSADFDATGLPSGVYFSRLRTAHGLTTSVKMVLVQ